MNISDAGRMELHGIENPRQLRCLGDLLDFLGSFGEETLVLGEFSNDEDNAAREKMRARRER